MRLRINSFYISISFPALAVFSIMIISGCFTNYSLCIIAVIIHELGHLSFMFLLKKYPDGVEIKFFNIKIIERERFNTCFYKDVIITLAGPALNIICFIIFYRVYNSFALVNLFVGLLNLLPAATLDGGQLIYLIFLKRYNAEFSAKIIDIITIITAFPLFLVGILVLLYSKYNFSLLFIALYLVFTLFIRDEKYL